MLTLSRYYRPKNGQAWRYYLKDMFRNLKYVTKYTWQRARHGWAEPDTWWISIWFSSVLPPMLRHLAERYEDPDAVIGIQEEYCNHPERWAAVLRQMASDLEAPARCEERWFGKDGLYKIYGDFLDFNRKRTPEELAQTKQCLEEENAAYARQKAGLAAFYEYFIEIGD